MTAPKNRILTNVLTDLLLALVVMVALNYIHGDLPDVPALGYAACVGIIVLVNLTVSFIRKARS